MFPIAPELQEWISTNIASRVKNAGVIKSAMILSKEYITSISMEQLENEIFSNFSTRNQDIPSDKSYDIRDFTTVEEAREWFYGK